MTKTELTNCWNKLFNNFLPISHELKSEFNERWFRIHTLPESKRYPNNEREYEEILRRHNLILNDLFGENNPVVLISMGYGLNEESIDKNDILEKIDLQKYFWMSINVSDDSDDENYFWNVFYDEVKFINNFFDKILRLIVDEEIRDVMFFSVDKKIVYHPYDGGADVIFENSNLRDIYKKKYKSWLSNHPQGL